ncbi:phage terminase large subunit [Brevundimonas sp.]|uniref:phage terminase large subunit n=1 Tax=Brevundimonas sp. TaxID=1871086 RepID=UPI0028AF79F3|nr:phage terminase large subunit [Brevundimonas sp.]
MKQRPETPREKLQRSFINFVRYVWRYVLGLPKPTRIQEDIARYLESGPTRRAIEALRGIGKSFITCAYVVWCLWRDPQKTVLIVSAGESGAADNANLIKSIIFHEAGDQLWAELRPGRDQRSSTLAFDVGPAKSNKQPSVKCLGITGQLAGNRADILIGDDVENQRNSATEDQRDKLRHATSEFGKIIKPLDTSEIIYLGTPQTEESIYNDPMKSALSCEDTLDMFIEHKAKPTHPSLRLLQKDSLMASIKSHVWTFTTFALAVQELARELPPRVTLRQLLTFALIVEEVSMGRDVTIAEIRKKAGSDKLGEELLGQSIGRSYQLFLKPTKKEPDALGWAYVEENENDRREKFLRLTPEGEEVALKIAKLLKEKP